MTKFWPSAVCAMLPFVLGIVGTHAQLDNIDLPKELPEELFKTNFSLNDAKGTFRSKCVKVAGEEAGGKAFTEAESGFTELSECLTGFVNYTAVQQEIEEASPRGNLDVVFNRYCGKRNASMLCFDNFTAKLAPCLEKEEQEGQEVLKRIVQSLLNFVCHKDGDQIALFIAESGPECLQMQKDGIQQCINSTFPGYLNATDPNDTTLKSLPMLTVGKKQCDDIQTLKLCVVHRLEQCTNITPANLVESMFAFVRNETVCRNYKIASSAMKSRAFESVPTSLIFYLPTLLVLKLALQKYP
ncbi:hypothetical protein KR009_001025 [Drosophila setifemur]|nr:hypothetical protein KR009_001025 [Drosophila setifemur]